MTFYQSYQLLLNLKINPDKTLVKVSKVSASVGGTSAKLLEGDIISIRSLLYGLMLPSGNDAAYCLAETFGQLIYLSKSTKSQQNLNVPKFSYIQSQKNNKEEKKNQEKFQKEQFQEFQEDQEECQILQDNDDFYKQKSYKDNSLNQIQSKVSSNKFPLNINSQNISNYIFSQFSNNNCPISSRKAVNLFVQEMNKFAQKLQMNDTTYANPHGLANKQNKSSAQNQGILATLIVKEEFLKKIISEKQFCCEIQQADGTNRTQLWHNTNKMLNFSNYYGVKTGITKPAGPCLSSHYYDGKNNFIVTILNSKSLEERWSDTQTIVNYGMQKLNRKLQ